MTELEITKVMLLFRETARTMWNQHFFQLRNDRDPFKAMDNYFRARSSLLHNTLATLDIGGDIHNSRIIVQPLQNLDPRVVFVRGGDETSVEWRYVDNEDVFRSHCLVFCDFFDFDESWLLDLRYVHARADEADSIEFLIDSLYCKFFLKQKQRGD